MRPVKSEEAKGGRGAWWGDEVQNSANIEPHRKFRGYLYYGTTITNKRPWGKNYAKASIRE